MTRDASIARDLQAGNAFETQHRCQRCNCLIPGLLDEDPSVGLAVELGIVSDECAFICDDCTAALIEARLVARSGAARAG
jgi:hypothetical protein